MAAMSDQDEGELVPFPPLPSAPLPPRFPPDPRQRARNRIIGAISSQLSEGEMQLAADIGVTGYPASGVNLGQIKDALEDALERFSMATLQARWESDVRSFIFSVLHAWVQRAKHMKADLCDKGIAIEIETQDDHGYYHYRFDVFPGRG
jgi:hypothetical protein